MDTDLTHAEVLARIRWVRVCMVLLAMQDDFGAARQAAATTPRKALRW